MPVQREIVLKPTLTIKLGVTKIIIKDKAHIEDCMEGVGLDTDLKDIELELGVDGDGNLIANAKYVSDLQTNA